MTTLGTILTGCRPFLANTDQDAVITKKAEVDFKMELIAVASNEFQLTHNKMM